MKTRLLPIFMLLWLLGCSKDAAAPVPGCQFKFKGVSYSFSTAFCTTVAGVPALQSADDPTKPVKQLILTQGSTSGIITPATISVHLNVNDPSTFYGTTSTPATVQVSGKTWTFNGTLFNTANDSGTISGGCNCTN